MIPLRLALFVPFVRVKDAVTGVRTRYPGHERELDELEAWLMKQVEV